MNIEDFRAGLDLLFEQNRISEVETYLEGALKVAIDEHDDNAVVHVLNEMIGFYRETCDYDRAVLYGEKALEIIESAGERDSHMYATTGLNLANALRAAGRLEESIERYRETERIYRLILDADAFDFASLYNNMSLVYQEARMYPEAIDCLNRAMEIVLLYPDRRFELAVTHANLGNSLLGAVSADPDIETTHADIYDGIKAHLTEAVNIFEERNENGAHLGAALMGLGRLHEICGEDAKAIDYYAQAMEVTDRNLGHVEYYYRARAGFDAARIRLRDSKGDTPDICMNGLELSRLYYHEVIEPMIRSNYPELDGSICAGLFGEGSDAYCFDDIESRDHDWGPGVILLINNKRDYDRFGQKLNADLLKKADETSVFHRFKPDTDSVKKGRRGVFYIEDYYGALLGKRMTRYLLKRAGYARSGEEYPEDEQSLSESSADASEEALIESIYLSAPEYALAACSNGEVWADPAGNVSAIRDIINEYYPEKLRRKLLMQHMTLFSQNAQYNYLRQKRRGQNASADMLLAEGMKNAARIAYILDKRYTPHDKWLFEGLKRLSGSGEYSGFGVSERIERVMLLAHKTPDGEPTDASMRPIMDAIDELSLYLQQIMVREGLITQPHRYMEDSVRDMDINKEALVARVVKDEWEAFDKVINEGGRADCQDNWGTFNIMRSSQYLTWTPEMLSRYAEDFEASTAAGWNPITEKYGRMEESTAPDKYAQIAASLPVVPDEKRAIIEEIVKIQVGWMEEFAKEYPKMASNSRTIHTYEDTPYDTSYETYLRGELMTYSDEMLAMYGEFIVDLAKREQNLAYLTMENTARLYGYKSLEDAEKSL